MANPYNTFQSQINSIGNQRDFTRSIIAQALAPQENQTALTGIARVLSAYLANKNMGKLDQREREITDQQAKTRRDEMARILGMTKDRPAEMASPDVAGPPAPAMKGMPMNEALMMSTIPEFQDMGLKGTLQTKADSGQIGTYNPRDYTEESFSQFVKTRDPSILKRYESQRSVMIGDVPHVFDPARGGFFPAQIGASTPPTSGGAPAAPAQPPKQITAQDVAENRAVIVGAESKARQEGKAAGEKAAGAGKAQARMNTAQQQTERVIAAIDDAKGKVGPWTAGFMGSKLASVSGTPAHDLMKNLETIRANIGFDRLQEMRNNSPTGGALGNVSEREIAYLQSVLSNLENSQSPEQLEENLEKAKSEIQQSWERVAAAYESDYGMPMGAGPPAPGAAPGLSPEEQAELERLRKELGRQTGT